MINLEQLFELGTTEHIDILEDLIIPAECEELNVDVLKSACMERCGLNIPLYPDPLTFKAAVRLWSLKNQYTFLHVDKIMSSEYSPIENVFEDSEIERKFDGKTDKEDHTDSTNKNHSKHTIKEELKNDKTDLVHGKKVTESGSDDNNTTNTISAYDSNNYSPDNKSENKITYGHVSTDSGTDSTTRNFTKDTTNEVNGDGEQHQDGTGKETKDDLEKTKTTRHGNIGVTSANKLQIEEYNMLAQFNPYTYLTELFERDLTLFVY